MSRLSGFGLAAAAFVVAVVTATASFAAPPPPTIDPAAKTAGMKDAPALIVEGHVPCTLADAREIGTGKAADKADVTLYEVACTEGMGYIIGKEVKAGAPLTVYNCLMMAMPGPDGKVGALTCRLPGNANPGPGLQPLINQAGRSYCAVDRARYLGATADQDIYEVACKNGTGLVLEAAKAPGSKTDANNCLAYATPGANISCTLTTPAAQIATIDAIAATSGKCAAIKAKRYVLSAEDGSDYFEVACTDGKGYILHVDHTGALAETIACAEAFDIGGGCTLTDAKQALTQQNALYADLAKKAGFDCAVTKYGLFPQSDPSKDVVELACSNRPDGGVGVFPAKGASQVYDCARSEAEGYRCTYTPMSAVFASLTQQIRRLKDKSTCTVSGARGFGKGDDGTDSVEVACSDGSPGYVIVYAPNSPAPSQLLNCSEAAGMAAGGCQLPTNKKG
jgi:hypothetical protein